MPDPAAKFGVPTDYSCLANKREGGGRLQILGLFFLFVIFFASRATAAIGTGVQYAPITSVGPGPSFAIADFDGDQRPDLARVEGGQIGSSSTDYRIEFRLTATKGLQPIQLVAPPGGLVIKALDVNGDHAVDLVLTTAWFKQPVAVLLNDGHGGFSRAEPSDFPGAFAHSDRNWNSSSNQAPGPLGILPQSRSGICSDATNLPDVRGPTGSVPTANSGFHLDSFLIAYAGRAPPFEIPQV
jgi:hypothetical protein